MATVQRRGYMVHLWHNPYERALVITEHAPLYLERHIYDRLDDDQFEAFMTAWLAGDYAQRCAALARAESEAAEPRPEPDTLTELVDRLREHGLTAAADFFASVGPVVARDRVVAAGPPAVFAPYERIPARGNVYADPDDTPWPTLDQEAYLAGREEPKPWGPCPDCLAPDLCEYGNTELCP